MIAIPARRLLLFSCLLLAVAAAPRRAAGEVFLTREDVALISEVFHLQGELGHRVWPGWTARLAPFLYKTPSHDVLLHHPGPPVDFTPAFDSLLSDTVWVRPNADTTSFEATFPIGGAFTAVLSRPDEGGDPRIWVLKAAHELFHVFQNDVRQDRVVDPFVGSHAGQHELSYPFPYDVPAVRSLMRVEAEQVFRAITSDSLSVLDANMMRRVQRNIRTLAEAIFTDGSDLDYKRWMEWNEGVARYTERRLAAIAAGSYGATEAFDRLFPGSDYGAVWDGAYSKSLLPVRFVGEGVRGRVQFYYLGMGKAYLLDRIRPEWRSEYFESHLDDLIESPSR